MIHAGLLSELRELLLGPRPWGRRWRVRIAGGRLRRGARGGVRPGPGSPGAGRGPASAAAVQSWPAWRNLRTTARRAGDLAHGPSPLLVALTLLPLGIPLLWLAAPVLTGVKPVFSFARRWQCAGLGGLTLGIGLPHGWTPGTRLRASLSVILVGYFAAGFHHEEGVGGGGPLRRTGAAGVFSPPDESCKVKLPGKENKTDGPIPGWELEAYRLPRTARARTRWRSPTRSRTASRHRSFARRPTRSGSRERRPRCAARGGEVSEARNVRCREQARAGRPSPEHPGREYVSTCRRQGDEPDRSRLPRQGSGLLPRCRGASSPTMPAT